MPSGRWGQINQFARGSAPLPATAPGSQGTLFPGHGAAGRQARCGQGAALGGCCLPQHVNLLPSPLGPILGRPVLSQVRRTQVSGLSTPGRRAGCDEGGARCGGQPDRYQLTLSPASIKQTGK